METGDCSGASRGPCLFSSETGSGLLSFSGPPWGPFPTTPRLCSHSPGFVPHSAATHLRVTSEQLASLSPPEPHPNLSYRTGCYHLASRMLALALQGPEQERRLRRVPRPAMPQGTSHLVAQGEVLNAVGLLVLIPSVLEHPQVCIVVVPGVPPMPSEGCRVTASSQQPR